MALKPVVTNFGDEKLYIPLSKEIERRLPAKSVDWRRTFGRLSKTVTLKANFTKFNSDSLGGTSDGTVNKQPFLHVYWTSCMENDEFRNGIKQKITNWQQNLESREINDWLIIQVVSQDSSKATRSKITLPRSSVYDKIKNDLCGKNNASRVIQLYEPFKETLFTKSAESWEALLSHMRQLLLDSISKHLTKFEEKVRHQREKYAEKDWSFLDYLKLNEELATIFKSVTLHEDALVQYDELDALFSQFVVNGKVKGLPNWLEFFTKTPSNWDGISLRKQAIKYNRDQVYDGKASLLELRNYIFIRQWEMLYKMDRCWDVAHRLLEFLYTVVNEIKILQVGLSSWVPACWVVSSCLEFLQFVEKQHVSNQAAMTCLAQILDYAREKLLLIGEECGLMPGQSQMDQLVDEMSSGLCKNQQDCKVGDSGSKKLLVALKSQKEFDKLYLYMCEKTHRIHTVAKKDRFANRLGVVMANFYLMKGEYENAERHLSKALREFEHLKWENLRIAVLEPLAICQSKLGLFDQYLYSLAALSCSSSLSVEKRSKYADLLLESAQNGAKNTISTEPILTLEDVKIDLTKEIGHAGEVVSVVLQIRNNLLKQILNAELEIRMRYTATDQVRLSEVSDGTNSLPRNTDPVNWSEVFKPEEALSSPSSAKPGLLSRIKSKRLNRNREIANSNDGHTVVNTDLKEDSIAEEVIDFKADVDEDADQGETSSALLDGKPKTLVEIATGLCQDLRAEDDDTQENSCLYSSNPIKIPNGGLGTRCDSAASALSIVSISSGRGESPGENLTTRMKDHDSIFNGSPASIKKDTVESPFVSNTPSVDSASESQRDMVMDSVLSPNCDEAFEEDAKRSELNGEDDVIDGHENDPLCDGQESLERSCVRQEDQVSAKMEIKGEGQEQNLMDDDCFIPEDSFEDESQLKMTSHSSSDGEAMGDTIEGDAIEPLGVDEEMELTPTQSLVSGPTTLAPGMNSITLSAKVMHEGRYNLQTLRCNIGNVTLFHLLELPRKSRAFFIVSDPPKFSWTATHVADCLLLGSKQRLYVTLSNGPGYIQSSSVVKISSPTGLEFFSVPPSSVMVYSPNKSDEPKEGAMRIESNGPSNGEALLYLPECGPYEMADLFFDVVAPVENADLFGHTAKHEVSLKSLWLSDAMKAETQLESIFYEPFSIEHKKLVSHDGNYLCTKLQSLNPVQINVYEPKVDCLNSENILLSCLCNIQMTIYANEELSLIWNMEERDKEVESPHVLSCRLTVKFKSEAQEELGDFTKLFEICSAKQLFAVSTTLEADEGMFFKGSPYSFHVNVKATCQLPSAYENGRIFCTLEDTDHWQFDDDVRCRKQEIKSRDAFEFTYSSKVIPCIEGRLRLPQVSLRKTVDSNNERTGNDSAHGIKHRMGSGISNKGLLSSRRTSATASDESAQPFSLGEVVFANSGGFVTVTRPGKQVTVV